MREQFFALIPDAPLSDFLRSCKAEALEAAGPQMYLEDAPHLTLGVGDYDLDAALAAEIGKAALTGPRSIGLAGWHTFADDPITGGSSLVLKVAPGDAKVLRAFQVRLMEAVSGRRKKAVPDRYADSARFPAQMLRSLERYGFPFVGEIWEPHFTIASFSPHGYAKAWPRLSEKSPPVSAGLAGIAFCQILDQGFVDIRTWELGQ